MQSVADARLPLGSSVTEEERGRVLVPVSASRAVSGELPGLQTGPSHRVHAWWRESLQVLCSPPRKPLICWTRAQSYDCV